MIFDALSKLERYAEVHPRFCTAFAFLREMIEKKPTRRVTTSSFTRSERMPAKYFANAALYLSIKVSESDITRSSFATSLLVTTPEK